MNQYYKKIVQQRKVRTLINGATICVKEQEPFVKQFRSNARKQLLEILGDIWQGEYGMGIKSMAFCAVICPNFYQLMHNIYAKITGTNKKYEVS